MKSDDNLCSDPLETLQAADEDAIDVEMQQECNDFDR